mmetsp:Transcript_60518/g.155941  ORF Transcript_60518/g.155941 Transcript_60518/m.155941 type:complete len:183 (+) Transcript_60518:83-631(+)|eukprot:CAMPEP_0195067838 /NCGR_PEP_ID=MMETSP0448-20130528/12777_1 /TAXON_ID=66468 /ORGANISM="Heterocapsa triquestra, Strain CCMP 448" /LENGTH=182 /DNA_ID=CAMNT_0040099315 /DNA_START=78 /DNA_END=626 /DNA_ORIENTATION=-
MARSNGVRGLLLLALGVVLLSPATNHREAFTGAVASPQARNSVAMRAGRDWRPGNEAKKFDFKAAAAQSSLDSKKKKNNGDGVEKSQPKRYENVHIVYNGKEVGSLNGTISEYKVDIWSGAHPVWQGKKGKVLLDTGSLTKFQEKYGASADIFGDMGMDVLAENKKVKAEQEKRKEQGLKVY